MNLKKCILIVSILYILITIADTRKMIEKQHRPKSFFESLLARNGGYDKQESPHGDNATEVKLGIYINSFYSISEQSMDYSLNIYLRQMWFEPRLKFDKKDAKNKDMIKLADESWRKLWVPDVFFRNEKRANFHLVAIPNRLMRLYSSGKIWYAMKISVTLSCMMKLQKYPLDTQRCPMLMESFGYTMDTVIFKWLDHIPPVQKEEHLEMPQYSLTSWKYDDCSQNYTTGSYPCLQVKFVLKRDIGFFLIQVYIPTTLIVILSWVSFWINTEATPARISLGLLTVLTISTQSASARSSLPRVSYIKAIDVWMSVCLLFVFAALLEFAVVNVYSSKTTKIKQLPDAEMIPFGEVKRRKYPKPVDIVMHNGGRLSKPQKTLIPDPTGKIKARKIDEMSRKLFPLSFLIFNLVYWITYNYTFDEDARS